MLSILPYLARPFHPKKFNMLAIFFKNPPITSNTFPTMDKGQVPNRTIKTINKTNNIKFFITSITY